MRKKNLLKGLSRWLMLLCMVVIPLAAHAQGDALSKRISLNLNSATVVEFFDEMKKQTGLNFIISSELQQQLPKISISARDKNAEAVLQDVMDQTGCYYKINGNYVTITKGNQQSSGARPRIIQGIVTDETGEPLPGATVSAVASGSRNETSAVVTDVNGHFSLTLAPGTSQIEVSYVGFQNKVVRLGRASSYEIAMVPDAQTIDEVVVNGAFERKANTYTGAVTTVKGEDLQKVGNTNVLQSLKNIDPSFMQIENLMAGSNPNALPDFQMRGGSTIASVQGEYASSANQPLFILDGFETELTKIMDLDMNQVESVTTLKDATAKAIYGSKAANGVIVIETKRPESGRMRVTYTGSMSLEVPDLTSYNLTNAAEKL